MTRLSLSKSDLLEICAEDQNASPGQEQERSPGAERSITREPFHTNRIWIVHFQSVHADDFFRVFTTWKALLQSISQPIRLRHPSWDSSFRVWSVILGSPRKPPEDVTMLVKIAAQSYEPDPEEEEQNPTPQF